MDDDLKSTFISADELMTAAEVCRMLGIARTTLHRYSTTAKFPRPLRLSGSTLRYRRSAICAWLAVLAHRSETEVVRGDH